jgi:WD40 repeat protein
LLRVLGAGGMGVVFQAEDPQLQRLVALKAILPNQGASESARERFLREARAAAAIKHDHIVTIYQVGEDGGTPFLAMEFLEGESLEDRLRREGRLPVAEVLRIGREVAEGLAAAHERDLIHRDIKPANIWLESPTPLAPAGRGRKGGRAKILDFGLARAMGTASHLTQEGTIVGTPAYMAPEQTTKQRVDARCDLFSLGCVLYRAATGKMPFEGADLISLVMAVATAEPKPPRDLNPELPSAVCDLIGQLLAKLPAERPASARAVVQAIQAIEQDQTEVLQPGRLPGAQGHAPAGPRSRRRLWLAAVAAVLLGAVGTAALHHFAEESDEDGGPPPAGSGEARRAGGMKTGARPGSTDPGERREPLSVGALVTAPAPLPKVQSWTIETRGQRGLAGPVAFNPKTGQLACGGSDGTIRIIDPVSRRLLQALLGHSGPVTCLAWSPDGQTLASGGGEWLVRLWEGRTGPKKLRILPGHTGLVRSISWSPDGKRLATASDNQTVRVWRADTGKMLFPPLGHPGTVTTVAWSPAGKLLASVAEVPAGRLRLWDADTGKPVGEPRPAKVISWSPDGKTLVIGDGKELLLLDTSSGQVSAFVNDAPVLSAAWSPDGKWIASSGEDGALKAWDASSRQLSQSWRAGPATHLAWSPDSKTVALGGGPRLQVWNVSANKLLHDFPRLQVPGVAAALAPGGKVLACGHEDGTVRLWDLASGQLRRTLDWPGRKDVRDRRIVALAWASDRILAGGGEDGLVQVWDGEGTPGPSRSFNGPVLALQWSPDGKTLACLVFPNSRRRGGTLQLWKPGVGPPAVLTLAGDGPIRHLSWSPDGKTVASGSAGPFHVVRLWDAGTGQLRTFKAPPGMVFPVAFAPDGQTLASGGRDGTVRLWQVKTGQLLHTLRGHTNAVSLLAWSPDGKILASGSPDRTVRLWQTETGAFLHTVKGHARRILGITWSPDGKRLVTWSGGRLHLTNAVTGKHLHFLLSRSFSPLNVAWSPDGRTVISSHRNGKTELWEVGRGRLRCTLIALQGKRGVAITPDGHYCGTPGIERELVYVVQTAAGQETLEPQEFARRYRWKNDPKRVGLNVK